jgi:hypothetical protein
MSKKCSKLEDILLGKEGKYTAQDFVDFLFVNHMRKCPDCEKLFLDHYELIFVLLDIERQYEFDENIKNRVCPSCKRKFCYPNIVCSDLLPALCKECGERIGKKYWKELGLKKL